ncbi:choice-of-anchor I family protein [Bradyrhizobium sp. WSM 1738]|uniref:choice-of-anchor I family protein n=1 Tax=Bradyrhizobium hereditatis TaxID=2821405 RepID=UPI001CE32101|nr:choice-of-anchor I family protein [Bradyrhizobium hereditatis]MCA6116505.1 choice-of-anchor I family protein [Bradyrhizobium hereditatis]
MALVPGSIAFIGYNADGNDGFAFIVLDTIDPGQVIHFSDNEWDGSAFNSGEGGFSWTNGATALAAGTVVEFLNTSATKSVNIGTVSAGSIALGNSGESIYAFTGSSLTTPTTFLAAVTNNSGGFSGATSSGLLTNTGLIAGSTALVLPGISGADVAVYNPAIAGSVFASRADALIAFNTGSNFVTQDASGNQDADDVTPDAPFRTDPQSPISGVTFTIGAPPQPQAVAFAPASVSVSQAEGNAGTTTFTFTVERTGGTVGDISFSGQVSSAAANAADFSGPATVPFAFSGTIPAGQTSAVVVVQVAGDAAVEADEVFTLTLQTVSNNNANVTASLGAQATATGTIQNDDAAAPGNVINGITILDEAPSLAGATATPAATNAVQLIRLDNFTPAAGTNAEVVTFDATTDRAFVLNTIGNRIDIVGISARGATSAVGSIDLTALDGFGGANSVAVKNGVLAVAVAGDQPGANGFIALFDTNGVLIKTIEVGAGPDQIVFTADGSKLLVANEGEPFTVESNVVNPEGSVSIIDLAGGAANAAVATTIEFDALNGFESVLKQAGVSVLTGQAAAADIEPEYITVSPDGSRAYVTLQEVNAVAVIDLTNPAATKPIAILPLGGVDHNLAGNVFDGSDRDGTANLRTADVIGLLQPDAIASYSVGGSTYFITANEGDARVNLDDEANLADLTLDPTAYANAAALQNNTTGLGRLRVRQDLGDTDGDGDIDQIYAYGGRGISIFKQNADGTITKVRETGGEFEAIIARNFAARFNIDTAEGGGGGATDNRSDNKGPEPEGVDIGVINGRTYAFVGLERVGGVMIYDVTDPANASYVGYRPPLTGEGNAPEVTKFISAEDSPTGTALVLTANEGNSSAGFAGAGLTVYAALPENYTQEIRVASSSTSVSQAEGNTGTTAFTFTIERTNGTIGSIDVTLQLAAGASNGANAQDFAGVMNLPSNVTVTIPAGQASATVTINVAGDTAFEANESFTATITSATTTQTGVTTAISATQAVATGTIQNDDVLHIYDVQGAGHRSEYVGQQVTVRGIVTAIDASGTENGGNNPVGYYIQDAVGDGDYRTSDGVFVFLGTGANVTIPNGIVVGAEVQLTATVNEFAGTNQLSVTQLNPVAGTTSVLSTGNALPTAVRVGDVDNLATGLERKPALVSLGDDDVDTAPPTGSYDPINQGSDFWESLEGMRVTLEDVRVTSPFHSNFDEQFVTPNVGANPSSNSRGGLTISDTTPGTTQPADKVFDFNPERIQLDDEAGVALPTGLQTGDRLGDVTGVVNYANGQYEVNTTEAYGPVTAANLEKETTTIVENFDRIRVATFNVENLAPVGQPVDGVPTQASKFAGLAAAIVNNLKTPEIIALQEVLDNDGATSSSVTSASQTLSQLIDAIVAAGGPRYVAIDSPPIDNIGGIPNGNQRVAYLYDPEAVSPTARNGLTDIVSDADGVKVQLFPSANQIGQGNTDFTATRKSLPMEWSPVGYTDEQGGTFWTVNNHLSSKGGSAPLYTTLLDLPLYADPINGSAQQTGTSNEREGQAETINAFVDGLLANGSATDDRIVVLGDLNDFQFFPVVDLITGALTRTAANPDGTASVFAPGTAVLGELISKLPENERYSYSFDGNAQALDHILVSNNMFDSAQFDIVHINSEFIDQLSDHDPSVSSLLMSRSAAIATAGNDVFDQAAYTAKFGARGSLAGNDTIDGLGGDDRIVAGGGNDVVDGGTNGAAGDTAVFTGARSNYTITVQGGSFVITDNRTGSSDGIDTVSNVERFEFADRTLTAAELTDATWPVLTAATPADDATAVAAGNNIVLTFDEAVAAGTGNIVISNGAGDTRTIAINDASQVTISGNTVTINPTADLAAGATYDVTLASGVITDVAGNAFGGIAQNALDFTVAAPQTYKLQILHASDFEAGLKAIDDAPRFAAIVDRLEDQFANSITLASGDNYIPSPFFNAASDPSMAGFFPPSIGRADIRILNSTGIEASVIGNHEFDPGPRDVQNLIRPVADPDGAGPLGGYEGTRFAYLAANLNFAGEPDLAPNAQTTPLTEATFGVGASGGRRIAPSTILEENGEKIGVVGVTTPVFEDITTPGGVRIIGPRTLETDADFIALAAVIQPAIDAVIAQGVNKVIIVSQLQELENEQKLITFLKGVDVVIGGGSNTLLSDSNDVLRPGDVSEGEYAQIITNAEGKNTVLVNTDGNYKYVGRLVLEFDANGDIIPASLDPNINGAYATDDAGLARVYEGSGIDPFAEGSRGDAVRDITTAIDGIITQKDAVTFGRTDVYLEGRRGEVRSQETNLGNLSADANLWYAKSGYDDTVQISIKNGGGIRDSIGSISSEGDGAELPPAANPEVGKEAGEVSQLDIENSLRFNNALSLVTLTPQQLLEALENGVSNPSGIFAQVGGLRFSYDLTRPVEDRVRSVSLVDENEHVIAVVVADGEVVADAPAAIRMVTLSFLIGGANPNAPGGFNRPDGFRFAEYIAANPAFANRVDLSPDNLPADDVAARTGIAKFTDDGFEQDALAEYLAANFSDTPYAQADTAPAQDQRIQNLVANGGTDTVLPIMGTDGEDDLSGTAAKNSIFAKNGDDRVRSLGGNDLVLGGGGDDVIEGGDGDDRLEGGEGNDFVFGDAGNDTVLGGAGDDRLRGNDGNDKLAGGIGNDNLNGGAGSDAYAYKLGDGSDIITDAANAPADTDTLALVDINAADVTFRRFGNDTQIELSNGSVITLKDQRIGGGVEKVTFANGQELDRNGINAAIVNRGPVAVDDTAATVAEDAAAFVIPFADIIGNDTDADLDTLSITALANVVGGTAEIVADGIRFTPAVNFNGPASFEYTLSDGSGGSDIGKVSFTVTAVNDAPAPTTPVAVQTDEDTQLVGQVAVTDAEGDTLTYTVGTSAQHGTISVNAQGQYTYTPALNFHGSDSFVIKVSDGIAPPVDAVINVTVKPVNDAPTVVTPAVAGTNEDTQLTGQIVATDVDGDTLTYAVGTGPQHGTVSVNAQGQYIYTPDQNFNGDDSFVIKVSDGIAAAVDTVVKVAVAPVNDAPVTVADIGTTGENQAKSFDLLANDTDVEGNLPLSLAAFEVIDVNGINLTNAQAQSAFSIAPNGRLQFTPGNLFDGLNDGENATVSIRYTAADKLNAQSTGTFTLTVTGETDANVINGTNGTNLLLGTDGVDLINARGGIDFVLAQGGNDTVHAGEGNDFVFGGAGNDTLNGNGGRDNLFGEDGDDVLVGGAGNDLLYGGSGRDTFVFQYSNGGSGRDIVFDFRAGSGPDHDIVQLDQSKFADFSALMASSALQDTQIGVQISYDDGSNITLLGVNKASLTVDDFKFA